MRKANLERDAEILRRIGEGWSFRKVASYFNMSLGAIHKAYLRAKNKAVHLNNLSTV